MVPVIRDYPLGGKLGTWPVIGPKHSDIDFLNFRDEHYHVDARFVTAAQERAITVGGQRSLEAVVGSWPLASYRHELPKGRPALARLKCRRSAYGYAYGHQPAIKKLREHYGDPAEPIRLADRRLLCPHRKADLSSFAPGDDGLVICPLHGLRVRCAQGQTS
jgi:hypothetical protein